MRHAAPRDPRICEHVVEILPPERCELCARWLPYKGQSYGRCGKKAWKTPAGDWCRFYTRERCSND